ncbi:MAG: bacillithiol biosynthesis deacetylase BshB1 [Flavobacteriales bacterium]|nr:bacillithiol biosynthesis deacetylase BshB1 [Flavobacteriales bacterium]
MDVDILCITAHPDDVEISMAGTVLKHVAQGRKVGMVDLTRGELGTRGSAEIRSKEAEEARKLLGAEFREQVGLADGFFDIDRATLEQVIIPIRRFRPKLVLTNALEDRHPDHGRAASLVARAAFLSGLRRISVEHDGTELPAWRPGRVLHAIQDHWAAPDLVIDIGPFWEKKMEALRCFGSQFHDPRSNEPSSPISTPDFFPFLEGRAREMGRLIQVTFGEGFQHSGPLPVEDLLAFG